MNEPARLWADPKLVYVVAAAAAALLVATIWLFRRSKKSGRQAGIVCLFLSLVLHVALLVLVPMVIAPGDGASRNSQPTSRTEGTAVKIQMGKSEIPRAQAHDEADPLVDPLPVSTLDDLTDREILSDLPRAADAQHGQSPRGDSEETSDDGPSETLPQSRAKSQTNDEDLPLAETEMPSTLAASMSEQVDIEPEHYAAELDEMIAGLLQREADQQVDSTVPRNDQASSVDREPASPDRIPRVSKDTLPANREPDPLAVPLEAERRKSDFANRAGAAKQAAIEATGGDARTEEAVAAALEFLAKAQRRDGAWDPRASGAGQERAPLGERRGGAGARAETAITGLALLSFIGAGNTHRRGTHADEVFRGLVYLIRVQKPDGSLAGNASVYAANYSHGMAALAMAEVAAMTADASAVESTRRAAAYTQRMQHPTTGGFRYRQGDPGDLSQLGWQAMVLDGAHRANVQVDPTAVRGIQKFLRSVRGGTSGGLARYRPGERTSRTMTAESLATRLLLGERVPAEEIAEAEDYLLQELPGSGPDNYYYWYYATIALHQLQDDAWRRWNAALKRRLLQTQQTDGSWPTTTMWGGYGGRVYTTAMATLCLEAYYRHALRDRSRIAGLPHSGVPNSQRH